MKVKQLRDDLKYLKKYKGITYSFVGRQVGIEPTEMSHFVNGRKLPKNKLNDLLEFLTGYFREIK